MKCVYTLLVLLVCFLAPSATYGQNLWKQVEERSVPREKKLTDPVHFLLFSADEASLRQQLFSLSGNPAEGQQIALPMPDGSLRAFRVWQSPMMPDKLAAKYPGLRTFNAIAVDDQKVTAKLDFTSYGFHAVVYDGKNVSFIDPADNNNSGFYMIHDKKDEIRPAGLGAKCAVSPKTNLPGGTGHSKNATQERASTEREANGYTLLTFRLALSCDDAYARAATGLTTPTIAQVLSKVLTTMNRVNGVYERELSITMNLVDNEDTLIWPTATGSINGPDPFDSVLADSPSAAGLYKNQFVCDARIGSGHYDIGQVFTVNSSSLSEVGVTCQQGAKAMSLVGLADPVGDGFDIDYVCHEMGHEYGANHPFNDDQSGNCTPYSIDLDVAYEPGSGSTIMAYAGICSPDDLQPHSDAYFHSASLTEILFNLNAFGGYCAVKTPTNNKLASLPPFSATYSIPFLTPFELIAPAATDSVADTLTTYCWEQWDLGIGQTFSATHDKGPIFRSYYPTTSTTRIFPKNEMVLAGKLSNVGTENNQGEKAPDVARTLTFHLTARDIYNGYGCFVTPDDLITLNVVNTGKGFTVTSQDDSTVIYFGASPQQVTWNVVGSNESPINAQNVEIYMSKDGGNTWTYDLGTYPNTGSAFVMLPNPDTTITKARIKVKGAGNVFFNVNGANFTVLYNDGKEIDIKIFPVPAHSSIVMSSGNKGMQHVSIFNAIGQQVWKGQVDGELLIPLYDWAPGVYIARFIDDKNQRTIKKFVVQ